MQNTSLGQAGYVPLPPLTPSSPVPASPFPAWFGDPFSQTLAPPVETWNAPPPPMPNPNRRYGSRDLMTVNNDGGQVAQGYNTWVPQGMRNIPGGAAMNGNLNFSHEQLLELQRRMGNLPAGGLPGQQATSSYGRTMPFQQGAAPPPPPSQGALIQPIGLGNTQVNPQQVFQKQVADEAARLSATGEY